MCQKQYEQKTPQCLLSMCSDSTDSSDVSLSVVLPLPDFGVTIINWFS